ncbi:CARDB domain-containing protein [Chloroflexota bacterium]
MPKKPAQLAACIILSSILILTGCGGTEIEPDSTPVETAEQESTSKPASFSVSNLEILKSEVEIGEKAGISVLVTNTGDESGSFVVELRINGTVVDFKDVTLAGNASETVSFKNTRETSGEYTVMIGNLSSTFVVVPPPDQQEEEPETPAPVVTPPEDDDWVIPTGTGTNLRAVHMGGNWGTNTDAVEDLPEEYFRYLRDLNVNWVGISIALHVDGSMDSTVEFQYEGIPQATFRDEVFRKLIRAFRRHGFNVYIHVAFEATEEGEHPFARRHLGDPFAHAADPDILPEYWPWRTDHPQHQEFVTEFWQTYTDCIVHIAQIAEEEGAGMLTLGTETDRLFRSRTGGIWPNNYLPEMLTMAGAVRNVYSGMVGYEMLHFTLVDRETLGSVSWDYLARDLGLDFIALSAYFPLTDNSPGKVMSVEEMEAAWEDIFNEYIIPLQERNPGKPIIFTEFGYSDVLITPYEPGAHQFTEKIFDDGDGNGLDDGEEAQANCIEAFFNVVDRHPGMVIGSFLWDVMMSTDAEYQRSFGQMRCFNIRGKLAEDTVRERYAEWFD